MSNTPEIFDRGLIRQRKGRAALRGAMPRFLLDRATEDILDRLALIKRSFPIALNFGAHDGRLTTELGRLRGVELAISMERSEALLSLCTGTKLLADEEALPFRDGSVDLVVSALVLQLVNDLPGTLIQIRRALRPDGLFVGALLGGETLKELREAWLTAEAEIEGGVSPRVAPFADVRELGGLLQRAGFALPVTDSDRLTVSYASPLALMKDLRAMGASNPLTDRRRTPVSKRLLGKAIDIYQDRFSDRNGRITATFEIVTLTAWSPHESQPKALPPGSAQTRLADALGTVEWPLPPGENARSTKG